MITLAECWSVRLPGVNSAGGGLPGNVLNASIILANNLTAYEKLPKTTSV